MVGVHIQYTTGGCCEVNVLGGAFVAFGDPNPPYCYVNVRSNAVDVHTLFGGFMSWGEFVPCLSRVLWRGRENIYACTYYRTSFLNDQPKEAYQTNEIAEWEAVPTISERQVLEVERAIAEAVLPHDYVIKPERLQVEGRIDNAMMEMSAALRQRYPDRGMRSDLVGPGAGWDAWRATAATEPWEIAIAAQMNR